MCRNLLFVVFIEIRNIVTTQIRTAAALLTIAHEVEYFSNENSPQCLKFPLFQKLYPFH